MIPAANIFPRQRNLVSGIFLFLANAQVFFGVVFLGWNISWILFIYWLESAVIGVYTIIKILRSEGEVLVSKEGNNKLITGATDQNAVPLSELANTVGIPIHPEAKGFLRILTVIGFVFHYCFFMFIHAFMLITLFSHSFPLENIRVSHGIDFLKSASFALLGLVLSHGISLLVNYFGNDEYKRASPNVLAFQPYKRIMPMHTVLFIGSFIIGALNAPAILAALLVIVKTFFDYTAHQKERDLFAVGNEY